jgi:hypothetical protein
MQKRPQQLDMSRRNQLELQDREIESPIRNTIFVFVLSDIFSFEPNDYIGVCLLLSLRRLNQFFSSECINVDMSVL